MFRLKKWFSSILCVLLICGIIGSVSACGGGGLNTDGGAINSYFNEETGEITIPADEKVSISFWGWGSANAEAVFRQLCSDFMVRHPNITVDYKCYNSSIYQTTLTQSAAQLPNLFFLQDYDFLYWVNQGVLWDFTDYVKQEQLDQVWEMGYRRYFYDSEQHVADKTENARLYGLPKDLGPFALCYNEDLVKQAIATEGSMTFEQFQNKYHLGDKIPLNWEEFIEMGLLLKSGLAKLSSERYVMGSCEQYPVYFSNNADYVNENGSAQTVSAEKDGGKFEYALQWFQDLNFKHGLIPASEASTNTGGYSLYKSEKAAFFFIGPWDCVSIWGTTTGEPWGFNQMLEPFPYGPGEDQVYGTKDDGVSTTQIGSAGYFISNQTSTSEAQRAASLMLAEYLCWDEEAQHTLMMLGDVIPNIKSMADEYVGLKTVKDLNGNDVEVEPGNLEIFIDIIDGYDELTEDGYDIAEDGLDRVTGKIRTHARTYKSDWFDEWASTITLSGFWTKNAQTGKPNCTAAELIERWVPIFDQYLNEYNSYFN